MEDRNLWVYGPLCELASPVHPAIFSRRRPLAAPFRLHPHPLLLHVLYSNIPATEKCLALPIELNLHLIPNEALGFF